MAASGKSKKSDEEDSPIFKNTDPRWCSKEESILLDAIDAFGYGNWDLIADLLAFECADKNFTVQDIIDHCNLIFGSDALGAVWDSQYILERRTFLCDHTGADDVDFIDSSDLNAAKNLTQSQLDSIGYMPLREDFQSIENHEIAELIPEIHFRDNYINQRLINSSDASLTEEEHAREQYVDEDDLDSECVEDYESEGMASISDDSQISMAEVSEKDAPQKTPDKSPKDKVTLKGMKSKKERFTEVVADEKVCEKTSKDDADFKERTLRSRKQLLFQKPLKSEIKEESLEPISDDIGEKIENAKSMGKKGVVKRVLQSSEKVKEPSIILRKRKIEASFDHQGVKEKYVKSNDGSAVSKTTFKTKHVSFEEESDLESKEFKEVQQSEESRDDDKIEGIKDEDSNEWITDEEDEEEKWKLEDELSMDENILITDILLAAVDMFCRDLRNKALAMKLISSHRLAEYYFKHGDSLMKQKHLQNSKDKKSVNRRDSDWIHGVLKTFGRFLKTEEIDEKMKDFMEEIKLKEQIDDLRMQLENSNYAAYHFSSKDSDKDNKDGTESSSDSECCPESAADSSDRGNVGTSNRKSKGRRFSGGKKGKKSFQSSGSKRKNKREMTENPQNPLKQSIVDKASHCENGLNLNSDSCFILKQSVVEVASEPTDLKQENTAADDFDPLKQSNFDKASHCESGSNLNSDSCFILKQSVVVVASEPTDLKQENTAADDFDPLKQSNFDKASHVESGSDLNSDSSVILKQSLVEVKSVPTDLKQVNTSTDTCSKQLVKESLNLSNNQPPDSYSPSNCGFISANSPQNSSESIIWNSLNNGSESVSGNMTYMAKAKSKSSPSRNNSPVSEKEKMSVPIDMPIDKETDPLSNNGSPEHHKTDDTAVKYSTTWSDPSCDDVLHQGYVEQKTDCSKAPQPLKLSESSVIGDEHCCDKIDSVIDSSGKTSVLVKNPSLKVNLMEQNPFGVTNAGSFQSENLTEPNCDRDVDKKSFISMKKDSEQKSSDRCSNIFFNNNSLSTAQLNFTKSSGLLTPCVKSDRIKGLEKTIFFFDKRHDLEQSFFGLKTKDYFNSSNPKFMNVSQECFTNGEIFEKSSVKEDIYAIVNKTKWRDKISSFSSCEEDNEICLENEDDDFEDSPKIIPICCGETDLNADGVPNNEEKPYPVPSPQSEVDDHPDSKCKKRKTEEIHSPSSDYSTVPKKRPKESCSALLNPSNPGDVGDESESEEDEDGSSQDGYNGDESTDKSDDEEGMSDDEEGMSDDEKTRSRVCSCKRESTLESDQEECRESDNEESDKSDEGVCCRSVKEGTQEQESSEESPDYQDSDKKSVDAAEQESSDSASALDHNAAASEQDSDGEGRSEAESNDSAAASENESSDAASVDKVVSDAESEKNSKETCFSCQNASKKESEIESDEEQRQGSSEDESDVEHSLKSAEQEKQSSKENSIHAPSEKEEVSDAASEEQALSDAESEKCVKKLCDRCHLPVVSGEESEAESGQEQKQGSSEDESDGEKKDSDVEQKDSSDENKEEEQSECDQEKGSSDEQENIHADPAKEELSDCAFDELSDDSGSGQVFKTAESENELSDVEPRHQDSSDEPNRLDSSDEEPNQHDTSDENEHDSSDEHRLHGEGLKKAATDEENCDSDDLNEEKSEISCKEDSDEEKCEISCKEDSDEEKCEISCKEDSDEEQCEISCKEDSDEEKCEISCIEDSDEESCKNGSEKEDSDEDKCENESEKESSEEDCDSEKVYVAGSDREESEKEREASEKSDEASDEDSNAESDRFISSDCHRAPCNQESGEDERGSENEKVSERESESENEYNQSDDNQGSEGEKSCLNVEREVSDAKVDSDSKDENNGSLEKNIESRPKNGFYPIEKIKTSESKNDSTQFEKLSKNIREENEEFDRESKEVLDQSKADEILLVKESRKSIGDKIPSLKHFCEKLFLNDSCVQKFLSLPNKDTSEVIKAIKKSCNERDLIAEGKVETFHSFQTPKVLFTKLVNNANIKDNISLIKVSEIDLDLEKKSPKICGGGNSENKDAEKPSDFTSKSVCVEDNVNGAESSEDEVYELVEEEERTRDGKTDLNEELPNDELGSLKEEPSQDTKSQIETVSLVDSMKSDKVEGESDVESVYELEEEDDDEDGVGKNEEDCIE